MSADTPLGKSVPNPREYSPSVLVGIPRADGRSDLGLGDVLPFEGVDVWNAHELSWLLPSGKPVVATAEFRIPASSPSLVESKSLKLYLNSLNGMRHEAPEDVAHLIHDDLEGVVGSALRVALHVAPDGDRVTLAAPEGACLDALDVTCDAGRLAPELLAGSADAGDPAEETLHSNLLRSNCPVTGQPDWAQVVIRYRGGRIDREALLRYVVSYREHDEFHEQCVERMFTDLKRHCTPDALTVLARYTRRGGLDINPFRSDFEDPDGFANARVWRQ
jgi:7-cyano-7-deazaguanine reductase